LYRIIYKALLINFLINFQREMFNKRGISDVIATLLLVFLTIVLIGIVWVVITNIASTANKGINLGGLTLDLKIQQATRNANNLSIVVQRQSGAGNLVGINFVVFDGSTYEVIKQNTSLDIYQGKNFIISPQQIDVNSAKTISVAPIYVSENGGAQQIGSITDTYTFGESSVATNGSANGGNSNSCIPASDQSGLCIGYTCGDVNNGTCSTVSCGNCLAGQTCNLVTHQCINGGTSCSPAPDATFAALCTNQGYTCGDVNNGTCSTVNCGSCGNNQYCSLSSHQCADVQTPACIPTTCQQSNYQCGAPPNGCGSPLNCGTCGANAFCDAAWQCETYIMDNSGTILSVWPAGAVSFFDSTNLPTSGTDTAAYNDGNHYVRFPGSSEQNCIRIAIMINYSPTKSYVELYSFASIAAGNNYQIWNNQQGCLTHPGYS
jgi:flagellin-like protein